ncbi:MAG: protoheme IX farnesyltransferase [Saprospiraceae bacterium]|nr:protoheme IX farnesyltransferase [Saprospiraceae bacterium]HRD79501.1 heme o synthase [Saprospiraceae bacterium]
MTVKAASYSVAGLVIQKVQDYKLLVKFRLSFTVVFSSVMAFLIGSTGPIDWLSVGILALGGFFVTAAANALNQVLEKDYDRLMKRTADRPLAAGRMKISEAVLAAGFMCLFGITLLALFNPWTAFLGMAAMVSYAFVYTPLKRLSPTAVTVGAIPGALPTMIGCVAAQGEITPLAWTLFAIQFLWQFPHFWSIGWLGFEDYRKAGFRFMPGHNEPDRSASRQAFVYAVLLIPAGLIPYWLGATGMISAVVMVLLGTGYAALSWRFMRLHDRKSALSVMFYSFVYIPLTLIALFADKI